MQANPPVAAIPLEIAAAAFAPSAGQSAVEQDGRDFTPDTIHRYRGGDHLPRLEAVTPVIQTTRRQTIVRGAIQVRTEPGAHVAAWAGVLGSFSGGAQGLLVRADAQGVATLDVRIGTDPGDYPFYVTSPTRSGVLTFHLNAE